MEAKIPLYRKNYLEIISSTSFNILFLIDVTGSMERHKNLCANSVSLISEKLSAANNYSQAETWVKFGFVAYRDKKDDVPFEICNFMGDQKLFMEKVLKLQCDGGGDACEDVKGALIKVLSEIKWDSQYKFIVMITDAPCHGKKYHEYTDKEADDYPDEDMTEELHKIASRGIHLLGVVFTDSIRKMYEEIGHVIKGKHGQFFLIENEDLKKIKLSENCDQKILNIFVEKISKPIEEFTKSTIRALKEKPEISAAKKFINENAVLKNKIETIIKDDGNFFPGEEYEVFSFNCDPKNINYKNIESFEEKINKIAEWNCQVSTNVVGNGSFRSVFLLRVPKSGQGDDGYFIYLAKAPIEKNYYEDIEDIKKEWRSSLVAQKLANKFNSDIYSLNSNADLTVNYNDVFILKSKKPVEISGMVKKFKYFAVEKFINGIFVKYNNNFGFVADFSGIAKCSEHHLFNDVAQAFSHYSFQKSDGYILVCDLQGSLNNLTDPIILSKNKTHLQGDLSIPGITHFFQTHKCNQICKDLGLEKMDGEVSKEILNMIEEIKLTVENTSTLENEDNDDNEEKKNENEIQTFRFPKK